MFTAISGLQSIAWAVIPTKCIRPFVKTWKFQEVKNGIFCSTSVWISRCEHRDIVMFYDVLHVFWTLNHDLVGALEHFLASHLLGMSSSQLTNICQRGWNHQPVIHWFFPCGHPCLDIWALACRTLQGARQSFGPWAAWDMGMGYRL